MKIRLPTRRSALPHALQLARKNTNPSAATSAPTSSASKHPAPRATPTGAPPAATPTLRTPSTARATLALCSRRRLPNRRRRSAQCRALHSATLSTIPSAATSDPTCSASRHLAPRPTSTSARLARTVTSPTRRQVSVRAACRPRHPRSPLRLTAPLRVRRPAQTTMRLCVVSGTAVSNASALLAAKLIPTAA
jgi:hypothetical protein